MGLIPPRALKVVPSRTLVADWEVMVKQPTPGQLFRSVLSAFKPGFKKQALPCRLLRPRRWRRICSLRSSGHGVSGPMLASPAKRTIRHTVLRSEPGLLPHGRCGLSGRSRLYLLYWACR